MSIDIASSATARTDGSGGLCGRPAVTACSALADQYCDNDGGKERMQSAHDIWADGEPYHRGNPSDCESNSVDFDGPRAQRGTSSTWKTLALVQDVRRMSRIFLTGHTAQDARAAV
jgi:hypothetical protein